jgi:hypothetical protein
MARREWALKIVGKQVFHDRRCGPIVNFPRAVKLVTVEHARAVRIVKKKIRSLEACIASDKRDGNEAGATLHVYALSILNSTLVEMQKGRA